MGQNQSKEEFSRELQMRMNSTRAFRASWLKKEGAMKFWKEDKENDAVYSVYLKKVRYRHSVPSIVEEGTAEQNSGLEWETVKVQMIKAASVERLVENLPLALQEMDSSYINVFFCTYQTFTNQMEVLQILLDRFKKHQIGNMSKEDTQKNIRSVILMWLDENLDDFREHPDYPCLSRLQEFAGEVFDLELGERARRRVEFFKEEAKEAEASNQLSFQASMCDEVDGVMMDNMFLDIKNVDSLLLAQQLTCMDADLFRKVNLQHCLGGMWSQRDKTKTSFNDVASVKATVTQFNDVCNRVMTTVIEDKTLRSHDRAAIIKKWIEVAQVCREMKNFSSAKAIIAGLQTHPVHRLRKVWNAVPRAHVLLFEDLASIFMDDNNFEMSRELLVKEGTAKFACVDSPRISRKPILNLVRRLSNEKASGQRRESARMHGTVPYLGTFLTDLIKIDVAYPDTIGDGLVNFEKKRKEFEVIAQIKLLQNAAKNYRIQLVPEFVDWFNNMNVMTYAECCEVSDEISGFTPTSQSPMFNTPDRKGSAFRRFFSYTAEDTTKSHRSSSSLSSTSSTGSAGSAETPLLEDGMSFSSESSPATSVNGGENLPLRRGEIRKTTGGVKEREKLISASYSMTDLTQLIVPEKHKTPETFPSASCRIIRISLEGSECNVYKSIVITQQEHTPSVIKTAAEKYSLPAEENLSEFMLVQSLPMGELNIPDNANVYYAMNANVEPNFMLKRKPPPGAVIKRNITKSRRTRMSWIRDGHDS
ncbi:ral guanine nucleotide dissociation stimulator-like isoform X2 [Acanthaster planci]|uniref:Ral guanine nucleotide dissociation stimulator-like isoform X2 n=1 Tax=Acanthaster planci TaxID=133434 RepID=A0A8B7XVS1_ACAPL|nr:ral guanine nucleotide dissociation stimulator-like isoform X2 [Acanthaster planci]